MIHAYLKRKKKKNSDTFVQGQKSPCNFSPVLIKSSPNSLQMSAFIDFQFMSTFCFSKTSVNESTTEVLPIRENSLILVIA